MCKDRYSDPALWINISDLDDVLTDQGFIKDVDLNYGHKRCTKRPVVCGGRLLNVKNGEPLLFNIINKSYEKIPFSLTFSVLSAKCGSKEVSWTVLFEWSEQSVFSKHWLR